VEVELLFASNSMMRKSSRKYNVLCLFTESEVNDDNAQVGFGKSSST
jgi:hypothetical protein